MIETGVRDNTAGRRARADSRTNTLVSVCLAATRDTTVGATIRSIRAQTYPYWEVIVIAQGDAEAVRRAAEAELPDRGHLRVIAQQGWGLSRARNAAIRVASGAVLAWTDDDCEASPDWLAILVECFERWPDVGLVGGAVIAPSPPSRWPRNCPSCSPLETLHDPAIDGTNQPPGWGWIGANFAARRSIFERVGSFDEHLGAGAVFPVGEDVDFMLRTETAGISMLTTPRASVTHTHGWRSGLAAVTRHQRNHAIGNGALAAKLSLLGDPRGADALRHMRRLARNDWLVRRRPVALPAGLRRLHHFTAGYRACLKDFRIDADGLLVRRDSARVAHG